MDPISRDFYGSVKKIEKNIINKLLEKKIIYNRDINSNSDPRNITLTENIHIDLNAYFAFTIQ